MPVCPLGPRIAAVLLAAFLLTDGAAAQKTMADYASKIAELRKEEDDDSAREMAERYVAAAKKAYGANHMEYAAAASVLGELRVSLIGEPSEWDAGEALLKTALGIREKRLGENDILVAESLERLAVHYGHNIDRNADAVPLYKRALAIRDIVQGPDHFDVAVLLLRFAGDNSVPLDAGERENYLKRSLSILENSGGTDHPIVTPALVALSRHYEYSNREREADQQFNRAVGILRNANWAEGASLAKLLDEQAQFQTTRNRYDKAEPLLERALAIHRQSRELTHSKVRRAVERLVTAKDWLGRPGDADAVVESYIRDIELEAKGSPTTVGKIYAWAGNRYLAQRRYDAARPHLTHAHALARAYAQAEESSLASMRALQGATCNIAALDWLDGRSVDAERWLEQDLENEQDGSEWKRRQATGRLLIALAASGNHQRAEALIAQPWEFKGRARQRTLRQWNYLLAKSYVSAGRPADALIAIDRAIEIGGDTYGNQMLLYFRALIRAQTADWRGAALDVGNAIAGLSQDSHISMLVRGDDRGLAGTSEATRRLRQLYRLALSSGVRAAQETSSSAFEIAQHLVWSDAAEAVDLMSARVAVNSAQLSTRMRDLQSRKIRLEDRSKPHQAVVDGEYTTKNDPCDLIENGDLDITRVSNPLSGTTVKPGFNIFDEKAADAGYLTDGLNERMALAKAEAEIFAELPPKFADAMAWTPLDIASVQELIKPSDALVFILPVGKADGLPEETFIWVITKTASEWVRTDFGAASLTEAVSKIRCGLDAESWTDAASWTVSTDRGRRRKLAQIARREFCKNAMGVADVDPKLLPFDVAAAHDLYLALFKDVDPLIRDKHLFVVLNGPLQELPLQVLVTEKPDASLAGVAAMRGAKWLGRSNAVTVLPAVASLKALKRTGRSQATKPMVAFANPLLDGNQNNGDSRYRASIAKTLTDCRAVSDVRELRRMRAALAGSADDTTTRGPSTTAASVKGWEAIPLTADQACLTAETPGFEGSEVKLAGEATESSVRASNLSDFRIIQFATHGARANAIRGIKEPALILTPPDPAVASEDNDGVLTASDIAELTLDADWVVLSACNTAASGDEGGEAFSGLARAFFFAGARSLLVSHWVVNDEAAAKLVSAAVTYQSSAGARRAEALKLAIAGLIDRGRERDAYPSYWAPFVVVGEVAAVP